MKIKTLISTFLAFIFAVTLFAQDSKKPERKKKREKTLWDKKVMVGGKDTRFNKRRSHKQYYKPGQDQK